jgi:hypothetical protein
MARAEIKISVVDMDAVRRLLFAAMDVRAALWAIDPDNPTLDAFDEAAERLRGDD